ncbi:MAG: metallothionein [Candidatus Binatia bacterium]
MAEQNCAHAGCQCRVEEGKGISQGGQMYCSEQCANPTTPGGAGNCGCGHAECGRR